MARWNAVSPGYGVGDFRDKLLRISQDITSWSRDSFGSVRREIKDLNRQLQQLRDDPARTGPVHVEIKICDRLVELYHREEIMWRQRSRLQWLTEGNRNTRFFHMRVSMRRKKNMIKALSNSLGIYTEDHVELKAMVVDILQISVYFGRGAGY